MSQLPYIPQMRPLFGDDDRAEIMSYLAEDGFMTEFRRTEQFEKKIAEFTGSRHCIVVNNGTVSLTLAAIALGIGPGDEVIVPNYTMIATPNSVRMLGAVPVFVDVDEDTLVADLQRVRQAVTPKTKAIMLVAANGRESRHGIDAFEALSRETGIPVIEDAAQGIGSWYSNGRHTGTVGRIGSLSFSAPKLISTGQGGALLTDDDELGRKLRALKDFGRAQGGTDIHDTVGYNFKFTELQACLGLAQVRQLPWRIERKKQIWRRYRELLSGVAGIHLFDHDLTRCTPWFVDCMAEDRARLVAHLHERGIGSRVMYPPINRQKAYAVPGDHPVSEAVGEKGLWLPSMIQLADEQVERVCQAITEFYASR
jgi:perosamine synthetase